MTHRSVLGGAAKNPPKKPKKTFIWKWSGKRTELKNSEKAANDQRKTSRKLGEPAGQHFYMVLYILKP